MEELGGRVVSEMEKTKGETVIESFWSVWINGKMVTWKWKSGHKIDDGRDRWIGTMRMELIIDSETDIDEII